MASGVAGQQSEPLLKADRASISLKPKLTPCNLMFPNLGLKKQGFAGLDKFFNIG